MEGVDETSKDTNKDDDNKEDTIEENKEVMESTQETTDTNKHSNNGSEYESVDSAAESYSEGEEEVKARPRGSDQNSNHRSGSETDGDSVILEREEGDGQESVPMKKVDDDEDKKNPQYIPKRGTFYEHDDRTADDGETTAELEKTEKDGKKKVWQDRKERWSHDRYNDNEQAPKSRTELISIYGYDIRNEDGPPRARRRRRYGRGPNKYTRNWEDEDAYNKPPLNNRKPPKKNKYRTEEFPPLTQENEDMKKSEEVSEATNEQLSQNENERITPSNTENSNNNEKNKLENGISKNKSNEKQNSKRVGTGRVTKPKKENQDTGYKGFTKARQYKSSKVEQKILPKKREDNEIIHSQNFTNKNNSTQSNTKDLEKDMGKLNIQDASPKNNKHANQRQTSMPPRLQVEQKGTKRYSSLRQRSLPETATPPFNQHGNYFSNEYNQQNQSSQQQGILHQPNQIHPSTTQVPQIPPPPLPPIPQVPVTATPILQGPPPQFASPFPQPPPAFLQPGVAPPTFITPQTPQIINYVQSQPQYPQAPFQGYQQQFNPVQTQPTELYQPQGGITYYSAQDQQAALRTAPQKRPKAAIPIVPPPPTEPRGRGRVVNLNESSAPNSTEITTENNKMNESNQHFEDATVTVQQ